MTFRFHNGDYKVRIADVGIRKYKPVEPVWSSFGREEFYKDITVLSTQPQNNTVKVKIDKDVRVIFTTEMNTSVTPSLNQVQGTNPGNWTFKGWDSTNVKNDTVNTPSSDQLTDTNID